MYMHTYTFNVACMHVAYIQCAYKAIVKLLTMGYSTVLLVDFRPLETVAEFNDFVDVCVYVCDGELKRNASVMAFILDGTARGKPISIYNYIMTIVIILHNYVV